MKRIRCQVAVTRMRMEYAPVGLAATECPNDRSNLLISYPRITALNGSPHDCHKRVFEEELTPLSTERRLSSVMRYGTPQRSGSRQQCKCQASDETAVDSS